MHNQKRLAAAILGMALAVLAWAALRQTVAADKDEPIVVPKKMQDAINKMADELAKDKAVDTDAMAFFKKHPDELKKAMWAFKPRTKDGKGGFGVGAKPDPASTIPDGIEGWILSYGNPKHKAMTPMALMKAAPDIERLADVTLALAAITRQYTPKKKDGDKDPKDWKESNDEMKAWALKLKAATKANKPDEVKTAFTKLYSSCNNCHAVFRDAADEESFLIPPKIRESINTMADAVARGEKIDKQADAFFKDHNKNDLKMAKLLFKPRANKGTGGFGIGPQRGVYKPDEIEGYLRKQVEPGAQPLTQFQLKAAAADLKRLADVTIVLAELMKRYKPANIIIGGPKGIATPANWTLLADDMKRGAVDLKAAIQANNPEDAKTAFTKVYSSCVNCHYEFR